VALELSAVTVLLCAAGCASVPKYPSVVEQAAMFSTASRPVHQYEIGPTDQLAITIFRRSDLSPFLELNPLQILPDGRVPLPLIGEVQAVGVTPAALREDIARRLSEYLVTPIVNVTVIAPTRPKIYVLGQVVNPGVFQIAPNTSAVEALALAGGATANGDLSNVLLFRGASGTPDPGKAAGAQVNLEELLQKADVRQNVMLEGADILYVPPDRMGRSNRVFTHASVLVSPLAQVLTSVSQILILTLAR
jgi:polysaccharide export outer membrane protein